jgi:MFS family permease
VNGSAPAGAASPHLGETVPPALPPASRVSRLFGSPSFLRLWMAQVVSAFGDWMGFLAIIVVAERVGGSSPGAAIALVMTARILPGFFMASVGGLIVDRLNRKRLLIGCDLVRAGVLLLVPVIDTVWGLVLASLVLEVATSLWSPAKESIVPNIVPQRHLTTANSLSLLAAYGTFPFAAVAFAFLAKLADWLGAATSWEVLQVEQESLGLFVDAGTFVVSAALIWSLPLVARSKSERQAAVKGRRIDFALGLRELREGWEFILYHPEVRAVLIGLSVGMIGGGMLIPLGAVYADEVLDSPAAGFGLLITALGLGVAAGVVMLSAMQRRLVNKGPAFVTACFVCGGALVVAASTSHLSLALACVFVLGVGAGAVYVLGFTILHESVGDELRGRVFAALYALVRFCLLLAIAVGGLLTEFFDWLFRTLADGSIDTPAG